MNSEQRNQCPICNLELKKDGYISEYSGVVIDCYRCGKYGVSHGLSKMQDQDVKLMSKLSAWIRERNESNDQMPTITLDILRALKETLPDYRVSEKQILLLRAFERRSVFPGQSITLSVDTDYPLAWAHNRDEFIYILRSLLNRGLISDHAGYLSQHEIYEMELEITAKGWDFLDEHKKTSVISDQAFVAMAFCSDLSSAWKNAISLAIKKANFKPYRVDDKPHCERIDSKIITEIKNSRFLVADVTHQRQGVYFEAGYAIGLGLPVIWCCRDDDKDNIHFDTRQYNHIFWKDEKELAEQLYYYVSAIIGKGSYTEE